MRLCHKRSLKYKSNFLLETFYLGTGIKKYLITPSITHGHLAAHKSSSQSTHTQRAPVTVSTSSMVPRARQGGTSAQQHAHVQALPTCRGASARRRLVLVGALDKGSRRLGHEH